MFRLPTSYLFYDILLWVTFKGEARSLLCTLVLAEVYIATATPHISRRFLTYQEAAQEYAFPLECPGWWEWLDREGTRVFRFTGFQGRFTARRENKHEKWYWYAYRKYRSILVKAYLDKSEELTGQRLEMVAQTINDRCHTPLDQPAKAVLSRNQSTELPPYSRRENSREYLPPRTTPGSYVKAPQDFLNGDLPNMEGTRREMKRG